jgi:RNA polymerase sigma-70 factor (ECF subfamily)
LRIVRNRSEVEEVVQDVFWHLWKSQLAYDPSRGRFTTWLFAVVRNRAIDRVRSLGRRPTAAPESAAAGLTAPGDPEGDSAAREQQRAIRLALGRLSDEQRETLELAFYEGYSHREIADRRGEPLGTVKSRIKRAMDLLRDQIAADRAVDRGTP